MDIIDVNDIAGIFPRPLEDDEKNRASSLISASLDLIEEEFLRRGRDFYKALDSSRLLQLTAKRIITEMISAAIHVGDNVGHAAASSTTGPQSDSVTFSAGVGIHWGGVYMTSEWLRQLGLSPEAGVAFQFPESKQYRKPEAYRSRIRERRF